MDKSLKSRKISFRASPSMSSSSSSKPPPETRNWLDLPREVTATILLKLGAMEILNSAQRVCKLWRSISKDPLMWRTIDMRIVGDYDLGMDHQLEIMCRHAIDRSCGQLVDITIDCFCSNTLLEYIANSTSHLRCLRLHSCYSLWDSAVSELAKKFPCLEELDFTIGSVGDEGLEAIGQSCPLLKSLKFNQEPYRVPRIEVDEEAFAIARTMPELRYLQLVGNKLTDDGVLAILDGCPYLDYLDLRQCYNVSLEGSLARRCAEIKDFRHPDDPTDDYPFNAEMNDDQSFDDGYPYGNSDIDLLSEDEDVDEYDCYGLSEGSDSGSDYGTDDGF